MIAPLALVLASLLGLVLALRPGQSDLLLLALPCLLASLFLLLRAFWQRGKTAKPVRRVAAKVRPTRKIKPRTPVPENWIIVDGSNVLHWKEGTVTITAVREVVDLLKARGFAPGVVFDANAGYKIADRYLHHDAMARQLGLPEEQVMVVPKGTQADPVVLAAARDLSARIVTNDRFRDWAEAHPEVTKQGHLIRGGYRDGQLWLGLDAVDKG